MTTCWKCGQSCNPRNLASTRLDARRGPCHRLCPRRKEKPGQKTYRLNKPLKQKWDAARKKAVRYECEVSGEILFEFRETGSVRTTTNRFVGAIDHIVPERFCIAAGVPPHDPINLICISTTVHGRKRAAEDAFLKRGDILKFYQELEMQVWPMDRVQAAMRYAGLRVPGEITYGSGRDQAKKDFDKVNK